MAISPEQRAILIERLKKAQEAKRVKAEARKAAAAAPAPPSPPTPKAEAKPPKVEKPKPAPKPAAPKVEKVEKVETREIEEKEIENEEPEPTPVVHEIYHADKKGTYVEITALPPYGEPEMLRKRSKPIDIPVTPKSTKDKGYMKLKFYKEPTPKVLKKIMKIHDESSSEEEEEEERAPPLPPPKPQPSQADAKRQHMKELANYYFNYY
jgi:hypothetical protein